MIISKRKRIYAFLWCFIMGVGFFTGITSADDNDEQLLAKGMWRDTYTGLVWMRCSIGQTWTVQSNCTGNATQEFWSDAMRMAKESNFGGHSDWRLPSIYELSSLLAGNVLQGQGYPYEKDKDLLDSKINHFYSDKNLDGYKTNEIFPVGANDMGAFWSSTEYGDKVWILSFYGNTSKRTPKKTPSSYVRLVRLGNQYLAEQERVKREQAEAQRQAEEAVRQAEEAERQAQIQARKEERERQALLKRESALPPQAMYLQAGKYDRNGQKYDAIRLYELLVDKYSDSPLAIQASNRLVAMQSDADAASRLRAETNRVINEANRQQSQSSAECRRRKEAYANSCGSDSYCYTRARSICSE